MTVQVSRPSIKVMTLDLGTDRLAPLFPTLRVSTPCPLIIVEIATFTLKSYPRLQSQISRVDMVGELHLRGKVRSGVGDLTAGTDGTIDFINIYQTHTEKSPFARIPLTVSKTVTGSINRPYPYEGMFDVTLEVSGLEFDANIFYLEVVENVYHTVRLLKLYFDIELKNPDANKITPVVSDVHLPANDFEEDITVLVARIEREPSIPIAEMRVLTLLGERRVLEAGDGFLYLANADGTNIERMLLLRNEHSLSDGGWPIPKDFENLNPILQTEEQQYSAFQNGFLAAYYNNNLSLVSGRSEILSLPEDQMQGINRLIHSKTLETACNILWDIQPSTAAKKEYMPIGQLIFGVTPELDELPASFRVIFGYGATELFIVWKYINAVCNSQLDIAGRIFGEVIRECAVEIAPQFSEPTPLCSAITRWGYLNRIKHLPCIRQIPEMFEKITTRANDLEKKYGGKGL